jgi:hypothetical protein
MADDIERHAAKKARTGWYEWLFPRTAVQSQTDKIVDDVVPINNTNPPSPHLLFQNLPVEAPQIGDTWQLRTIKETIPSSASQTPSRNSRFGSSRINRMRTNSNFSGSTNTKLIRKFGPLKFTEDKVIIYLIRNNI